MDDGKNNLNVVDFDRPEETGRTLNHLARRERNALLALVVMGLLFIIGALASGDPDSAFTFNPTAIKQLTTQVSAHPVSPVSEPQTPAAAPIWVPRLLQTWN